MSYCRWSSNDFLCDVYVYSDCNGEWRTLVASSRTVWDVTLPPRVPYREETDFLPWFNRHQQVMHLLDDATSHHTEPIAHPEAGAAFGHDTPGECADNLDRLRTAGFVVPQDAIDELRAEQTGFDLDTHRQDIAAEVNYQRDLGAELLHEFIDKDTG